MIGETDWAVIEKLQEGIPLCERPFAELAASAGISEDEFIARVQRLRDEGAIRRIGPRLRHHQVGVHGNIMVVWAVPAERLDEVGSLFAGERSVSHCYVRPPLEGLPYTLYTMVHARDMEQARRIVRELSRECGISDYRLLPTVRELKKSTPVYRAPTGDEDEN